jgi:hypothetical protein
VYVQCIILLTMSKINKSMRFDENLWKLAEQAGIQTRRTTTEYIEHAVEQQIRRDKEAGNIKIAE